MKEEARVAGLFASLAFLVVGVGGYVATLNPLHAMLHGVVASVVLAFIGYRISHILNHPQGRRKRRGQKAALAAGQSRSSESITPLTGEETFLEDMEA